MSVSPTALISVLSLVRTLVEMKGDAHFKTRKKINYGRRRSSKQAVCVEISGIPVLKTPRRYSAIIHPSTKLTAALNAMEEEVAAEKKSVSVGAFFH